jgi:hypothetical protein
MGKIKTNLFFVQNYLDKVFKDCQLSQYKYEEVFGLWNDEGTLWLP